MQVEFYNPDMPEGMEVDVAGVLLVNGELVTIPEEVLETKNQDELRDNLLKVQFVKVDGTQGEAPVLKKSEEAVEETTTVESTFELLPPTGEDDAPGGDTN